MTCAGCSTCSGLETRRDHANRLRGLRRLLHLTQRPASLLGVSPTRSGGRVLVDRRAHRWRVATDRAGRGAPVARRCANAGLGARPHACRRGKDDRLPYLPRARRPDVPNHHRSHPLASSDALGHQALPLRRADQPRPEGLRRLSRRGSPNQRTQWNARHPSKATSHQASSGVIRRHPTPLLQKETVS